MCVAVIRRQLIRLTSTTCASLQNNAHNIWRPSYIAVSELFDGKLGIRRHLGAPSTLYISCHRYSDSSIAHWHKRDTARTDTRAFGSNVNITDIWSVGTLNRLADWYYFSFCVPHKMARAAFSVSHQLLSSVVNEHTQMGRSVTLSSMQW